MGYAVGVTADEIRFWRATEEEARLAHFAAGIAAACVCERQEITGIGKHGGHFRVKAVNN